MIKKVIFFDVETNGVNATNSVLSISAMKITYNTEDNKMIKLDEFDRFYFRNEGEEPNFDALKINGLFDELIEKKREESNEKYPRTFKEDIDNFYNFCDNAEHYVAHNIRFDRQFIPFNLKYQFDTMIENIEIVKILNNTQEYYKWPKLMECAKFYNIPLDEKELHNSMYDVLIMARVMYKMLKYPEGQKKVRRFLVDNISTKFR
ncbi:3'-5' exonuclease [Streptobacillus felis]|uniref:3'-5' exonuclease n=1 Tax=Streptobacillus felis TaxID=1384509 RepID=A0A7Z0T9Z5_9FUSO|nr:3'-5' exonuclease [Streptobacillus felis]NYV27442.1 3'-5' exonuclease [Streptobacillus felis]